MKKCSEREKDMRRLMEYGFAVDDARLYLDTHPNDVNALRYYEKHNALYKDAVIRFTEEYGPVDPGLIPHTDRWTWTDMPWPWQEGV